VIGNVVYFSNLGSKTTIGLNAVSGNQVFSFPDGAFTPVIADYHAIYLDGYAQIYQLLPGAKAHVKRAPKAKPHKAKHAVARRHRKKVARAKQKVRKAKRRAKAKASAKKH
jgi:hypothetical protein